MGRGDEHLDGLAAPLRSKKLCRARDTSWRVKRETGEKGATGTDLLSTSFDPFRLSSVVDLVDLVHLVSFVQPKNQTDQTHPNNGLLIHLQFFRACGLASGRTSFASSRTAMSDRLLER